MSLKLSQYVLFSKKMGKENSRIMISTRTSKCFLITDQIYNSLIKGTLLKESTKEEIQDLIDNKILVKNNLNEFNAVLNRSKTIMKERRGHDYFIDPTNKCQLSCEYCGKFKSNLNLDKSYYKYIVKNIENKILVEGKSHISVTWLGGEPLLALDVVKELTDEITKTTKINNTKYSAALHTNGLALTPEIFSDLVKNCSITIFKISMHRIGKLYIENKNLNEIPEIIKLINTIKSIVNLPEYLSLSMGLTLMFIVDNKMTSEAITKFLIILNNFDLLSRINVSINAVHKWGEQDSYSVKEFANDQIKWFKYLNKSNSYLNLFSDRSFCGSLSNLEYIESDGYVYECFKCDRSLNEFKKGHITDDILSQKRVIQEQFYEKINELKCSKCKLYPICFGACPYDWLTKSENCCPPMKYNFNKRLEMVYHILKEKSNN